MLNHWLLFLTKSYTVIIPDFNNMHGCALNSTVVFGSDPLNGLLYKVDTIKGKMDYKKKDIVFQVIDHLIKWVFTPYSHA